MPDLSAQRRLVKSPPELWSELSELERLGRHLEAFGEIRITRLEPESEVAWEGERASGTVAIEASGWGTKVTLTARLRETEVDLDPEPGPDPLAETDPEADPDALAETDPEAEPDPEPNEPALVAPPEPEPAPDGPAPTKRGFFARLVARWRADVVDETPAPVEASPEEEPVPEPGPVPVAEPDVRAPDPEPGVPAPDPEPGVPAPDPEPGVPAPDPEPGVPAPDPEHPREREPVAVADERAREALEAVLDNLGSAHHRPFSRA